MGSRYTIKALDESSWDGFARLVEENNGVFGGCWCMGFHPDDSREPALNREGSRGGRYYLSLGAEPVPGFRLHKETMA